MVVCGALATGERGFSDPMTHHGRLEHGPKGEPQIPETDIDQPPPVLPPPERTPQRLV